MEAPDDPYIRLNRKEAFHLSGYYFAPSSLLSCVFTNHKDTHIQTTYTPHTNIQTMDDPSMRLNRKESFHFTD